MPSPPLFLDRALLPLRLARARAAGTFRDEASLGAPLIVEAFDLDFVEGEAAYNAIGKANDGAIWFAIGTKGLDAGARLYRFDPRDDSASSQLRVVADLDRTLATPGPRAIPQGKVHVDLVPIGDAMIGATHLGYYDPGSVLEQAGSAPGFAPYPGGHFFAVEHDRVISLAQAPTGEGIITMTADLSRGLLHALTWPRGLLLTLDLSTRELRNHGPVLGAGELGSKRDGTWTRVCRSLGVDPRTGHVFWSDSAGRILRFDGNAMETMATTPRTEMWRKVVWHPTQQVFYGVCWSSAALFRFDPTALTWEEIGALRVEAQPNKSATLAFSLDPNGRAIHALAAGPGVLRRNEIQLAGSVSHVQHDLATGTTQSSGPLRLEDGRWITQSQSLLLADGFLYSLCWVAVSQRNRSAHARTVHRLRRKSAEFRTRGYAEEMMLIRFRAE